jgi:arylsulfatase A-like enzyme
MTYQASGPIRTIDRGRTRIGRRLVPGPSGNSPALAPAPAAVSVVLLSAWMGLLTGLVELLILVARKYLYSSAALGSLQINRHYAWMIPTANLMIFTTVGLVLALVARIGPRAVRPHVRWVLVWLGLLTILLGVQRLHPGACVALAMGATSLVRRLRLRSPIRSRLLVPIGLVVMSGIVLVLGALAYNREALAEGRSLARLPAVRSGAENVLLIVLDTVRADHLGMYGYGRDTTPSLDRLARQGVRFERARATAPWTLPAHASMFTGQWPHRLFSGPHQPMNASVPTLAEFLRDRGYQTAGFVANNYFCNSWFGLNRGFIHYEDHFDGDQVVSPTSILRCSELGKRLLAAVEKQGSHYVPRKDAARINGDFLRWLAQRRSDRPFFAFLNYIDAHDPYLVPAGFTRHFGVAPDGPKDLAVLLDWQRSDKGRLSPREINLARDAYDDCIAALDERLGQLFDELERQGVLRNTLVIVTADHGEELGEHGLYGHAMSLYRPETHVPLLFFGPSVPRGSVVDQAVGLRQLPTTVLDLLGWGGSSPFPGRPLARLWTGSPGDDRPGAEPILSETTVEQVARDARSRVPAQRGTMRALVEGAYTYIRNGDGAEELYDLDRDPGETANLAGQPDARPVVERFRSRLERLLKEEKTPR